MSPDSVPGGARLRVPAENIPGTGGNCLAPGVKRSAAGSDHRGMTMILRVLLTGVLGAALVPAVAAPASAAPAPAPGAMERAVVAEMNAVRAKHHRPRVRGNLRLTKAARAHSRSLQRRGVLSHDGPKGAPFWSRIVAAGFSRRHRMAENIAMVDGCGRGAARRTVRMWMKSPPHRANLLDRRLRLTGAGVACNRRTGLAIVTADYTS